MTEETDNGTTTIEATKTGVKITGKKTAELLTFLLAIGVALGGYVLWKHTEASEIRDTKIEKAMASVAGSQRFFACVIAHPQDQRMQQIEQTNSLCNRIAKE